MTSAPTPGLYPVRFGTAELLRDADRPNGWMITVDGVPQSHVNLDDPTDLEFDYVRRIGDVIDCLAPGPLDALHVGGAACTLPRYVAATRPRSRQLIFDADAELVAMVREQLDLKGLKVRSSDGREGVAGRFSASADLVVVDAFERGILAGGLATVEFTAEVARVLRPAGTYIANVSDGPNLPFLRRFLATLATAFPHLLVLAEPAILRGRRFGNLVVAASRIELPVTDLARRAASSAYPARCVSGPELARLQGNATPITDAAPLPSPVPPTDVFGLF